MWRSFLQFIKQELAYAGHLQAVGVASIVFTTTNLAGIAATAPMIVASYLLLQAVYYYDRYHDLEVDRVTNKVRTEHFRKYEKLMPGLIGALLTGAILLVIVFSGLAAVTFSFGVIALGLLYPKVFKKVTRHVPLFKNIYVSAVFAVFILFPFVFSAKAFSIMEVGLFFLFVLAEGLIMQVILDVKDIVTDKRRGILTLPVMIGKKDTIRFLVMANLVILASVVVFAYLANVPAVISLAIISFVVNMVSVLLVDQAKSDGYVLASAKYLFWPLVARLH